MIVSCNNCKKKFEVDSDLIPDEGRLLKCSSCNNEWFFKHITPIKIVKSDESYIPTFFDDVSVKKELKSHVKNNFENHESLIKKIQIKSSKSGLGGKDPKIKKNIEIKKNKRISILSIIIIFIISFIAIIILLDTFKYPISKIIPDIEFILYNLYETISDIKLFFKDLI